MKLKVNGKEEIFQSKNLREFLVDKGLQVDNLVVLLNEDVVQKHKIDEIELKSDDVLEILNFVSGG